MSENYPQVTRTKRIRTLRGDIVQDDTVRDATPEIHSHSGSLGAPHASQYSSVLAPPERSDFVDAQGADTSKRTPRAAEKFMSVLAIMPPVHFGLSPEDLAEPLPEEENASRREHSRKPIRSE